VNKLALYVSEFAERGACTCGKCFDGPENPEAHQPTGPHTSDLFFFKVQATEGADAETLKALVKEHRGEFCEVDPFDGRGHDYMELGGWIGDQGLALMMMGLGEVLGLWKVSSPNTFGDLIPDDMKGQLAGMGMVTITAEAEEATA
jgi:hypothetical protein